MEQPDKFQAAMNRIVAERRKIRVGGVGPLGYGPGAVDALLQLCEEALIEAGEQIRVLKAANQGGHQFLFLEKHFDNLDDVFRVYAQDEDGSVLYATDTGNRWVKINGKFEAVPG